MLDTSLIAPDNHFGILATLCMVAAFGLWAEKTKWGARLSAVVIAIGTTFVLSNLSIIPVSAPVYDMVWSFIVPLSIPLLLFRANLRRIIKEAGPTLIAFVIGGIGTVLGTLLAFWLVPMGEHGWQLAAIFCSTYIGGSINYVSSSKAVGLVSGDLLTAGVAADNLVMTLYMLVLFALPNVHWLKKRYKKKTVTRVVSSQGSLEQGGLTLYNLSMSIAISSLVCAVGFGLAGLFAIQGIGILFVTALVVFLATLFPKWLGRIEGGEQIGTYLMQIFFATIGASANIHVVIRVGPVLFLFAALILIVHLLFILIGGKLCGLALEEIVIASNANMGGPTTAAAMAVTCRWQALVIPAILCGTLGYAVATFIGVGLGFWLAA